MKISAILLSPLSMLLCVISSAAPVHADEINWRHTIPTQSKTASIPWINPDEASLKNCQGAVIFDSCDNYSIANAAGNGLYLMRNGITVRNVKIYHPSCEGIAVHASNCTIDGAVIEGSKGAAIALCGSNNVLKNVTVIGCSQPLLINGMNNTIDWATFHTIVGVAQSGAQAQPAATTETAQRPAQPAQVSAQTAQAAQLPVTSQTNSSVHARLLRPTDINQAAPDL